MIQSFKRWWVGDARAPVDTRHIGVLDGIRALAIFIVAWFHIWQQSWLRPKLELGSLVIDVEPLVKAGYILVDTMLLLSGFLLFLPYARHMIEGERLPSLKAFYVRRGARILPSYWLSLAVVLFGFALPLGQYAGAGYMWRDIFTHLTFTHVFAFDTYVATRLNVVLWTLAIEVQFYLIFPLLARLFIRRPGVCYILMVGAGLAFRRFAVAPQADTNLWVNQLPAFLDVYANGMLAALIFVRLSHQLRHTPITRLLFTTFSLVLLVPIWTLICRQATSPNHEMIRIAQANNRFFFSVLCSLFILSAANAGALLRGLLANPVMRVLSAVSFQYYIWHQYIAVQLRRLRFPPSVADQPNQAGEMPWQWLFTLVAFLLPLVISLVLTYGFEQPLAKWIIAKFAKPKTASQKGLPA